MGVPSEWQARISGQAGSSIVFQRLRRRSIRYCGLHIPAGHGAAAGFPCGQSRSYGTSISAPDHIQKIVFLRSGRQQQRQRIGDCCAGQFLCHSVGMASVHPPFSRILGIEKAGDLSKDFLLGNVADGRLVI